MGDPSTVREDGLPDDSGCRYIQDNETICGAPQKRGSSYCAAHHALCHLTPEQAREKRIEIERLALLVGGRCAARKVISRRELAQIEQRSRGLA